MYPIVEYRAREPWNKGKLVGQKSPLKLKDIWAIRIRLQLNNKLRDLTLLNLAIDSKLRACDLTKLKVSDVAQSGRVGNRAMIMQQKTKTPVQFEMMEQTRDSIAKWIEYSGLRATDFLFPSRVKHACH
jgi:integrase